MIDRLAPAGVEVLNSTAAMRALLARAESGEELARRTLMNDPGDRSKAHRQQVLARKARKRRDAGGGGRGGRGGRGARRGASMPLRSFYHAYNHPGPALIQSLVQALLLKIARREAANGCAS